MVNDETDRLRQKFVRFRREADYEQKIKSIDHPEDDQHYDHRLDLRRGLLLRRRFVGAAQSFWKNDGDQRHAVSAVRSVSQLTTVEYHYTNMGKFEKNADLNGWTIPLIKASFILAYDGKITAGVRLDDVQIDVQEKTITITAPAAEILGHAVDEASIGDYDESTICSIPSASPITPPSPSDRKR